MSFPQAQGRISQHLSFSFATYFDSTFNPNHTVSLDAYLIFISSFGILTIFPV